MSTGTDREILALRAAYAVMVDRAPAAPEFEDLQRGLATNQRPGRPLGWRPVLDRPLVRMALAAAAIAVVVVPILSSGPSAVAAMEEARGAFERLSSFSATLAGRQDGSIVGAETSPGTHVADRLFRQDLWYRGDEGWRVDIIEDTVPELSGGPGSQAIWDGNELNAYRADENSYTIADNVEGGFGPMHLLDPNNATWPIFGGDVRTSDDYFEQECRVEPDAKVAGRTTRHLSCEAGRIEIWLDVETGLVLKSRSELAEHEVTRFEFEPEFEPGTFEFIPPSGATEAEEAADDPYRQVALAPNEAAPLWEGRLLGGESPIGLSGLKGKPTLVLLWADWCEPCVMDALPRFAELHTALGDMVNLVAVDVQGSEESAAQIVADAAFTFPVVIDDGCAGCSLPGVSDAWSVESVPIWVVLDTDGVVVEVLLPRDADTDRLVFLLTNQG